MNARTNYGRRIVRQTRNDLDNVMFSLHPKTMKNDIVDVMLMIMDDDGPEPMRNLKPAEKRRNGAEQFHIEHQKDYEGTSRDADKMARVSQHNNAYPKMYDELNKRKSMTKTKAIDSKPHNVSYIAKRSEMPKKAKLRSKGRQRTIRPNRKHMRSRVSKSRSRCSQNSFTSLYKMVQQPNKGCQNTKHWKNITISDVSFNLSKSKPFDKNNDKIIMPRSFSQFYDDRNGTYTDKKRKNSKEINKNRNESKHGINSLNQDTSHPSISSYNSYLSMDHEPMVAP